MPYNQANNFREFWTKRWVAPPLIDSWHYLPGSGALSGSGVVCPYNAYGKIRYLSHSKTQILQLCFYLDVNKNRQRNPKKIQPE
jgi:hypothetical protein